MNVEGKTALAAALGLAEEAAEGAPEARALQDLAARLQEAQKASKSPNGTSRVRLSCQGALACCADRQVDSGLAEAVTRHLRLVLDALPGASGPALRPEPARKRKPRRAKRTPRPAGIRPAHVEPVEVELSKFSDGQIAIRLAVQPGQLRDLLELAIRGDA